MTTTISKFESNHQFSASYLSGKHALLDSLDDQPRDYIFHRHSLRIAAAMALVLLIGSTTAVAGSKLYRIHLEKNHYQTDLVIQPSAEASYTQTTEGKTSGDVSADTTIIDADTTSDTPEDDYKPGINNQTSISTGLTGSSDYIFHPMKIVFSYLPEGIEPMAGDPDKYSNPADEDDIMHSISPYIEMLDYDGEIHLQDTYVVSTEEFTAGGCPAYLINRALPKGFDKVIYVLFEKEHCLVSAFLGYGITGEEAKQIASGIRLEPAKQENASITFSYAESMTYNDNEDLEAADGSSYMPTACYKIGDSLPAPFTFDSGLTMIVKQADIYDSIKDFDRNNFFEDEIVHYADTNGNLLAYDREYYTEADGILTLPKLIQTKHTKRKFVYLTIQVANSRKRDTLDFPTYYNIDFCKEEEDGTFTFDEEYEKEESVGRPVYFDASLSDNRDKHFFYTKIPAGQTVTFHIGYIVDEDHLDEMFLRTDGGSAEIYYLTDIRQRK